jgi:hypothetical protein
MFAPAYMGRKRRGRSPHPTLLLRGQTTVNRKEEFLAHGVKALEKPVFGPCTLVRTWGTRPEMLGNEIRSVPSDVRG